MVERDSDREAQAVDDALPSSTHTIPALNLMLHDASSWKSSMVTLSTCSTDSVPDDDLGSFTTCGTVTTTASSTCAGTPPPVQSMPRPSTQSSRTPGGLSGSWRPSYAPQSQLNHRLFRPNMRAPQSWISGRLQGSSRTPAFCRNGDAFGLGWGDRRRVSPQHRTPNLIEEVDDESVPEWRRGPRLTLQFGSSSSSTTPPQASAARSYRGASASACSPARAPNVVRGAPSKLARVSGQKAVVGVGGGSSFPSSSLSNSRSHSAPPIAAELSEWCTTRRRWTDLMEEEEIERDDETHTGVRDEIHRGGKTLIPAEACGQSSHPGTGKAELCLEACADLGVPERETEDDQVLSGGYGEVGCASVLDGRLKEDRKDGKHSQERHHHDSVCEELEKEHGHEISRGQGEQIADKQIRSPACLGVRDDEGIVSPLVSVGSADTVKMGQGLLAVQQEDQQNYVEINGRTIEGVSMRGEKASRVQEPSEGQTHRSWDNRQDDRSGYTCEQERSRQGVAAAEWGAAFEQDRPSPATQAAAGWRWLHKQQQESRAESPSQPGGWWNRRDDVPAYERNKDSWLSAGSWARKGSWWQVPQEPSCWFGAMYSDSVDATSASAAPDAYWRRDTDDQPSMCYCTCEICSGWCEDSSGSSGRRGCWLERVEASAALRLALTTAYDASPTVLRRAIERAEAAGVPSARVRSALEILESLELESSHAGRPWDSDAWWDGRSDESWWRRPL